MEKDKLANILRKISQSKALSMDEYFEFVTNNLKQMSVAERKAIRERKRKSMIGPPFSIKD